jgi:hypothetical protein
MQRWLEELEIRVADYLSPQVCYHLMSMKMCVFM